MAGGSNSAVHLYARGGQIIAHRWAMAKQVLKFSVLWMVPIAAIFCGVYFYKNTTEYQRYLTVVWAIGEAKSITGQEDVRVGFRNPNGTYAEVPYALVKRHPIVRQQWEELVSVTLRGVKIAGGTIIAAAVASGLFFIVVGSVIGRKRFLRGSRIVGWKELRKQIKRDNRKHRDLPGYELGGIPYPAHTEQQHTLIVGSTGSGKSNILRDQIAQVRRLKDRAIIYDRTGALITEFFDPKRDILLNPLDSRGVAYSLFNDVNSRADMDQVLAALIPEPKSSADPFWNQGARIVAGEAGWQVRNEIISNPDTVVQKNGRPFVSTRAWTRRLLRSDLTILANSLVGSAAASVIDPESPKTAVSIRAIIATYFNCLRYLKDEPDGFSIRDWVENGEPGSFLFIGTRANKHESLKPLISLWMDIAINALLSLDQSRDRRLWVFLDEVPSLQRLPSLGPGLAESRQFGGCFALGVQGPSQVRDIYGPDGAETIFNLCKTRVILNLPDEGSAKWASLQLGRGEVVETAENISYGASQYRDGVSLSERKTEEAIVLPSEIQAMANLTAYIRFANAYPVTFKEFKYRPVKRVAESFVPRPVDEIEQTDEPDTFPDACESPGVESAAVQSAVPIDTSEPATAAGGHGAASELTATESQRSESNTAADDVQVNEGAAQSTKTRDSLTWGF